MMRALDLAIAMNSNRSLKRNRRQILVEESGTGVGWLEETSRELLAKLRFIMEHMAFDPSDFPTRRSYERSQDPRSCFKDTNTMPHYIVPQDALLS